MDDDAILSLFSPIYDDIRKEDEFDVKKPLLAHYTSLRALEKILTSDEIWLSNPLFMNDLEEVKFGILNGIAELAESDRIKTALNSTKRHEIFTDALDHYKRRYEEEHLFDTYVFCFSEHNPKNTDGMLSMWRGYGGNGSGAAIIFDSSKFEKAEDGPLMVAKVRYGSVDERYSWFEKTALKFAEIIETNDIKDDKIYIAAHSLFERLKLFALFTKHEGFTEEAEWRAVYFIERDTKNKMSHMMHYHHGDRGIEPKLKFPIIPIKGETSDEFSLEKIIHSILLGPNASSPLALKSIERMLESIDKPKLKERLHASTIPLRKM